MAFINHCFVCQTIVDESKFGAVKKDGRWVCSEECSDEYLDMGDSEFEKCKKIYEESLNEKN